MNRIGFAAIALTLLLTATSCGEPQQQLESGTMGSNAEVGDVVLRNVFVEAPARHSYQVGDDAVARLAMFTRADRPDSLEAVRSAEAQRVVMRADRNCDGTSEDVSSISIPAEGTVSEPGSIGLNYHLVLVNLTDEVLAGTTVPLTFTFREAGEITVSALVEANDGDVPPPTGCDRARKG